MPRRAAVKLSGGVGWARCVMCLCASFQLTLGRRRRGCPGVVEGEDGEETRQSVESRVVSYAYDVSSLKALISAGGKR